MEKATLKHMIEDQITMNHKIKVACLSSQKQPHIKQGSKQKQRHHKHK